MIIESDAGKEASAQIEGPFKTTTLMMKGVYLEGVCETSPEYMYAWTYILIHICMYKTYPTYTVYTYVCICTYIIVYSIGYV